MVRATAAVAGAAAAVALSAGSAQAAGPAPPSSRSVAVATVLVSTQARTRPARDAKLVAVVSPVTRWTKQRQRLRVLGSALDAHGHRWLLVRLAVRPNTAQGWVAAADTRLTRTPWRVTITLRTRQVTVRRYGRVLRSFSAVIGTPATPTPTGRFAIFETARQRQPDGFIGPWALHLTAHSDVLKNYGGGPGRVALHGRAGASLADPLGSAASHGCVRVDNTQISWMAAHLGAGTPVDVVA